MNPTCHYIIGIAGGTASGKSTLARKLSEDLAELRVTVIGMDQYFKADKPVHRAPLTGQDWPDFNSPDSFHLDQLVTDLDALIAAGDVLVAAADAPEVVII